VIWSSHGAGRPRRLIVLAIAVLIPALAGCEAGDNAPTNQWHQPTEGAAAMLGDIAIRNVFVLGPSLGAQLAAGQSASVFFAVVNGTSPDKLLSVSAPGAAKSVTLPGGSVSLGNNQSVLLTGPAPEVILQDLTRPLTGSSVIRMVMTFQNAGSVSLLVPVVPRARYFATLAPPPIPSPAVKKRKRAATASPPPGSSGTPAATPTPSSTP
jgi:hypothetical protein